MAISRQPRATLHLPRILCLHGGGTNAEIFRLQMRSFLDDATLSSYFRFVFVDAPFFCAAGPGIHPVYSDFGPFRRWSRWLPEHEDIDDDVCREEVIYALQSAMEEDDRAGATGEWVGTLGFSQGAKFAASLLYEMQLASDEGRVNILLDSQGQSIQWRFGIILAGRAPFSALSETTTGFSWVQTPGGLPEGVDMDAIRERPEMKLRIPTVHVHGLKDHGLHLHRRLRDDYCAPGTTVLVEWDGNHRVPFKKTDVEGVVKTIMQVADEYDVV